MDRVISTSYQGGNAERLSGWFTEPQIKQRPYIV
nr:MAG TPA: hypothetical protein [Caudoviricetes sp.]